MQTPKDPDDDLAALYPQSRPRPHADAPEGRLYTEPDSLESPIFRNEVVPEEDNPLRGWRRMGAELLPRDLWPREAMTNPVMVYFTGRQRGRLAEDLAGLSLWPFLLAIKAWVFFSAQDMTPGYLYSTAEIFLLPLVFAVFSGSIMGSHIRRCLRSLPLEQLMTTPLKAEDIVQGLTIRPLAVQAAGILVYCLLSLGLVIGASFHHLYQPGWMEFIYAVVGLPALGMFLLAANEVGGAFGARVNFCIRDSQTAMLRLAADLIREFALFLAIPIGSVLLLCVLFPWFRLLMLMLVLIGGCLFFGVITFPILLSHFFRSHSREAMHWVCEHPEEWWVYGDDDTNRVTGRIGLWRKWDYLVEVTPEEYRRPEYD